MLRIVGPACDEWDSPNYSQHDHLWLPLGVPDAHYTLAFVYLSQGDKAQAVAHLRMYAKLHPDDPGLEQKISEIMGAKIEIRHEPPPNYDEMVKKKERQPPPKKAEGSAPR